MIGSEIDNAVDCIRRLAPHPALRDMEDRVLLAIAASPSPPLPRRTVFTAMAIAAMLGILSHAVPQTKASATSVAPIGAPANLAPSSLLMGSR